VNWISPRPRWKGQDRHGLGGTDPLRARRAEHPSKKGVSKQSLRRRRSPRSRKPAESRAEYEERWFVSCPIAFRTVSKRWNPDIVKADNPWQERYDSDQSETFRSKGGRPETLLEVLREDLGLRAQRRVRTGDCGACTVVIDDQPILSVSPWRSIARASDHTSKDWPGTAGFTPSEGFAEKGAVQCGFCTRA